MVNADLFADPDPYGTYTAACDTLAIVEVEHARVVKTWEGSCTRLHEAEAAVADARRAMLHPADPSAPKGKS